MEKFHIVMKGENLCAKLFQKAKKEKLLPTR
jgi:hypothetical protein